MRRSIALLFLLMFAVAAHAQWTVGIHESHYAYVDYSPVKNLSVRLEHSIYSEAPGLQRICVGASYGSKFGPGFGFNAGAMGGTTWNGNYQVVWGFASLDYTYRRLVLEAMVQPRYDSGLHYTTCWQAKASVEIIKPVKVLARYTTIPEYRMSEKRVAGGFEFNVSKLMVRPELSFSMENNTRFKNLRVLMSMQYIF